MNGQQYALALLALGSTLASASVQRSIRQEAYSPYVLLTVAPPANTDAYAVEENLDGTAIPTQISQGGAYDTSTRKIKWGPFTDGESRTFSYRLSGPAEPITLNGKASFDGTAEAPPNTSLSLPNPATTFFGYQFLNRAERDFIQFPLDTTSDTDGDGISEFTRYALAVFGSNLTAELQPANDEAHQSITLHAFINSDSADTAYALEASENFSEWAPIENRIPNIQPATRTPSETVGIDKLTFSDIPLDPSKPLIIRLRATWLATQE